MSVQELRGLDELKFGLAVVLKEFNSDRKKKADLKTYLSKEYKIPSGTIQRYLNQPEDMLNEMSEEELYVLSEGVYVIDQSSKSNPKLYFPDRHIKEYKTNFESSSDEQIEFPLVFENVLKVSETEDDFITIIDGRLLVDLWNSELLQYNKDTQREGRVRKIKKRETEEIFTIPKIMEKSVKEMEKLIVKGQLISTMITFNARLGSSDEGVELIYDEKDKTLTVSEGTLLDILDGFHRTTAMARVLMANPELNTTFKLNILNYNKERAQEYFAQLNTTNPVSKGHIRSMKKESFGDYIAEQLKFNSHLKGLVYQGDRMNGVTPMLVTFKTLANAIEIFDVKDRAEAIKVSRFLAEFINELFESKPDEFLGNIVEVRKTSVANLNQMFTGYMALAKKFRDEDIDIKKLDKILKKIDFSRDNKLWKELGVLDENNHSTGKNNNSSLIKYFQELKVK